MSDKQQVHVTAQTRVTETGARGRAEIFVTDPEDAARFLTGLSRGGEVEITDVTAETKR